MWGIRTKKKKKKCVLSGNLVDHRTYLFNDINTHLQSYKYIYIYIHTSTKNTWRTGCDYVSVTNLIKYNIIDTINNNDDDEHGYICKYKPTNWI